MGDDDKPFACTAQGCNMRFTNEDHLTVHKKKHEMSLNLHSNCSIKSTSNLFVGSFCDSDQTPTPTRFIRNCEEVGLFQDLQNVNPFEEQFRKAAEAAKNGNNTTLNGVSDPDTLNTPSILPSALDSDLVVSTTTNTDTEIISVNHTSSTNSHPSSVQPSSTTTDSDDDEISVVSTSISADTTSSSDPVVTSNSFHSTSSSIITQSSAITSKSINSISAVTQSSLVTTAVPSPTQVIQLPSGTAFPDSPIQQTAVSANLVAQSTPVIANAATVVQLLLKLPDGRSIPVQIPTVPVVPATPAVTSTRQPSVSTVSSTSIAKMKLKQALTQNQQNANGSMNIMSSNMRVMTEAVEMVTNQRHKFDLKEVIKSENKEIQTINKRRRASEEDPDEKRRRFLERNRAAATRCRLKRKQWIQSLEKKAEELSTTNQQLQNEVAMLRNEVAQLKTMLLAHKDCPITLQQKALNQAEVVTEEPINLTTVQITSAEAIASSALTNMAHTASGELNSEHTTTHILPVSVVIETDPDDLLCSAQENSNTSAEN